METVDGFPAFPFFDHYTKFLIGLNNPSIMDAGVAKLKSIAMNLKTSEWRRFASTKATSDLRNNLLVQGNQEKAGELTKIIEDIKANETDPMLKQYYGGF